MDTSISSPDAKKKKRGGVEISGSGKSYEPEALPEIEVSDITTKKPAEKEADENLTAEKLEKQETFSNTEEKTRPIEEKELSEPEVRDKLLRGIANRILPATRTELSQEKIDGILTSPADFPEKISELLEKSEVTKIKSISLKQNIFTLIDDALKEAQRQDAKKIMERKKGGLSEETLNQLEQLEKKYEAAGENIIKLLKIEQEEGTGSGVKFIGKKISTDQDKKTREKKYSPEATDKNKRIKEILKSISEELSVATKKERDLPLEKEDAIISGDANFQDKIKTLLDFYIENKMDNLSLLKRQELFKIINEKMSEMRLREEIEAAGPEFRENMKKIYDKYKNEQLKLFEYFKLGTEDKKTGKINYAEGVDISIEE